MNRRRYEDFRELADRLALVCVGGRRLGQYVKKAPRKAAADLTRLRKWWSPNIAGFGIGPKNGRPGSRLAIRFYVHSKVHKSRVREGELIPEKISVDHLKIELRTDVQQLEGEPVFHAPLFPGTEVAHFTGTVGTVGCYVQQTGSSTPLLLSCAHVLAPFGAHPDEQIESPVDNNSQTADDPVGLLLDGGVILRPGSLHPTDAALASLLPGITADNTALELGPLNSMLLTQQPLAGVSVEMRGAATAQRVTGVVSSDMLVTLPFRLRGQSYQVQNLMRYEISARAGDSGSALVQSGTGRVIGLHVGAEEGTTHAFFAPTFVIATLLGVDLFQAPDG